MTFTSDPVRAPEPDVRQQGATTKPRVHRRGALEYVAWFGCALVAFGVVHTLFANENYQWNVVTQYLTAPTVLRGLVMTIVLTVLAMSIGTVIALFLAVLR